MYKNRSSSLVRLTLIGVVSSLASMFSGCSAESDSSEPQPVAQNDVGAGMPDGMSIEMLEDGSAVITKAGAEPSSPNESAEYGDVDKAGCAYIQYCDASGDLEVICRCQNGSCSDSAVINECITDANYVCGNWSKMRIYFC
jgi:hypothetical protein